MAGYKETPRQKMITAPQTILIVSHRGWLREILRLLLGLPRERHWSFQFDHASLSEVHVYDNYSIIMRINDTQHLREV